MIILGLVLGVPRADREDAELYVYAGSIVIATLVQLLLPVPWLRGLDGRLRLAFDWRDPAVSRFRADAPRDADARPDQRERVIGTFFASRLIDPTLAPRAIDLAFRLYMLPQGMFSVAVATILFPTLARLAARGDLAGFRAPSRSGLRQIAFLLFPAGVVSAVLAEPITRLVYQRGEFEPDQTPVVAGASPRSRSGSSSTAGCCSSTAGSTACSRTGFRPSSRSRSSRSTALYAASTASACGGSRSRPRSRTSPAPSLLFLPCGGARPARPAAMRSVARARHGCVGGLGAVAYGVW